MKRFIRNSKYLDETTDEILFDDSILVDIEIDIPLDIEAASRHEQIVRFPGLDQFKQDVINVLENEYHFEVIEDVYDGVRQKGYTSDREGSLSLYFDTYFDLANCAGPAERMKSSLPVPEKGKIYCFIHLRFSDHVLIDSGDVGHRKFVADNAKKYTANRPDVTHVVEEDFVDLSEEDLAYYYDEAIADLREQLDVRILYWMRKAERFKRRGRI